MPKCIGRINLDNELKPYLFLVGYVLIFYIIARELDPKGFGMKLLVLVFVGILFYASKNWKDD
tara:strand:- start:91 stop:279 length:189 start_codon:yes stop_codon:yes gene_type:complete